jgi:prolyl-tRNA synthetase
MIYTQRLFPTHHITVKADGFAFLEAAGYVKTISSGCIALLPLGVLVMRNITETIRHIAADYGFSEVALPLLQKRELWEKSGRATKYSGLLCETTMGDNKRYIINPTQEEAILDLFCSSTFHVDDLPLRLFQIGERARNEIRPAHGLIRARCFNLADFYALCRNEAEIEKETQILEQIIMAIGKWAGLPIQKAFDYSLTKDIPTYSYWIPSTTKLCTVTICRGCGVSYRVQEPLASCPKCGDHKLDSIEAIEIGHVMQIGKALSEAMSAVVPNTKTPVQMVIGGIGLNRFLQLMAEHHHDKNGLTWPIRIAPYIVHVIAISEREKEARDLFAMLEKAGYTVLLDLRARSLGWRLIDADLFGIPIRVVLGNKTPIGTFDVKERRTGIETKADTKKLLGLIAELVQKEGKIT